MSSYTFIKSFRRKGLVLFFVLILIVSVLFVSLNNATENLQNFAKNSWINYVGDVRISGKLTSSFLEHLLSQNYTQSATGLSLIYANVYFNNGFHSALLIYCSNPNGLMGYEISEGNDNDLLFVTSSNLKLNIGDEIKIIFLNKTFNEKISGYASAFYNFGLVDIMFIVNKSLLNELGISNFDYIFAKFNNKENLGEKLNGIAYQTNSTITSIISLDPNAYPGKEDIDAANSVFNIFTLITLIVIFAALASYQFIYLEMNEKELGYLQSLGFTKRDLLLTYTFPQLLILVLALVVSILLSIPLSRILFDAALKSTPITFSDILLNRFQFKLEFNSLVLSLGLISFTFLVSLIPIIIYVNKRRETFIRERSPSYRTTNLRFKMLFYSSSNRVWRHVLLIIIFALIISSTSAISILIENWNSSVVELNIFYDYFIYASGKGNMPEIPNATVLTATFHLAKVNDKSVVTGAFLEMNGAIPKLLEGRWPSKHGEAVVSVTLAKDLNLKLGDNVSFSTGFENLTMHIVGIAALPLFYLYTRETDAIILSYEEYSKLFTTIEGYAIYLKGNPNNALDLLKKANFILSIRSRENSINIALQGGSVALVFLNFLSYTFMLSSVSLVAIFIISELYSRTKEYALFLLLGYRIREILVILTSSLFLLSLISFPISYIILIYILNLFQNQIISFTGYFDLNINLTNLVINFFYILLPIFLVFLIATIYLKKIKINEVLLK